MRHHDDDVRHCPCRSGALWCIHKPKILPVRWCRSQLGHGEWDARNWDATTDALAGGLDWRDFVDPNNPGQRGPGCD